MSLFNSLKVEEKIQKNNPYHSLFSFYHLPTNMGITIGNCLRRILLGYIKGIAICGVEIADSNGWIKSEFSLLSGLDKNVIYLISNLKEIVFEEKKPQEGIFCLELSVENKKKEEIVITAADFSVNTNVKIKNPELILANLAPQSNLKIKLHCQKNIGYQKKEQQKKRYFADQDDVIVLDSDYSPIKGDDVKFQVNPIIISLNEQEEKLIIDVKTNGQIKPANVLNEALEVIDDLTKSIQKSLK